MKYVSEKMIAKSRFSVLFERSDERTKDLVKERIADLVSQNKEYADDKNYAHLCNLLTSLAFVQVYMDEGMSREERIAKVRDAMYEYIAPQKIKMQKFSSNPLFIPFLKFSMPIKFGKTLGHGWEVECPDAPSDEFTMITHRCIYDQIFRKYELSEMTAVFCYVDDILYSELPGADFIYTQQIGCGGSCCDYTFKKKK